MDDQLIGIATRCAARWRWHPDHEDLLQTALIAAWQHADEPLAHIGRHAKHAIIDEVRRLNGKPGSYKHRFAERPAAEPLERLTDGDPELPMSLTLGLTGDVGCIVDALVAGRTKRSIAAELGIEPSAVSHRLTAMRPAVASALNAP